MPAGTLFITGDKQADALLNRDGTALLIGMLLDQQVPMEWAFAGPATLKQRLGHLDAKQIAAMDDAQLFTLDEKLKLKGRSAKEKWVQKAKDVLAAIPEEPAAS